MVKEILSNDTMLKGGSSKKFVDIDADPTLLEGSKCEVWKEDSKILEV
jgi:hypothetical protein